MYALFKTIDVALNLYSWVIIASAVFSWLYTFNVVNPNNRFVGMIGEFLYKATETCAQADPALCPQSGPGSIFPRSFCFC